ncbi:MAG TPA: hypothetical protein PLX02_01245 [Syntrophorhabdaceae bacterium]|nr:hypothetical protein [Syntrophorhabdaceae bacterium]HQM80222.1 hypothetical protein [Syntrophorhabdaceae bacterium]
MKVNGIIDTKKGLLQDEINEVFKDGTILTASEERLQMYLKALSSDPIPNDMVRHREIIRALTINHIQMQRHVDSLNRKNNSIQIWIIILAGINIIVGFFQIYTWLWGE